MPFGPYSDFADCVSKNKDKKSPEGYCAIIHKKITGDYPSEKNSLSPKELREALFECMTEEVKPKNETSDVGTGAQIPVDKRLEKLHESFTEAQGKDANYYKGQLKIMARNAYRHFDDGLKTLGIMEKYLDEARRDLAHQGKPSLEANTVGDKSLNEIFNTISHATEELYDINFTEEEDD